MHRLFQDFAHRYDLHTPARHYRHDRAFVLEQVASLGLSSPRLLDIGCGTGILVEAAMAQGIDAYGADAAPGMIDVAAARVGPDRVRVERMQDLDEVAAYDVICALSWTVHYCADEDDLREIIRRTHRALKPGGLLVLQVANADATTGAVRIDREPGPNGQPDDTIFIHRFERPANHQTDIFANYIYASEALSELLVEHHHLRCCDPRLIMQMLTDAGLESASRTDISALSPFVTGVSPRR